MQSYLCLKFITDSRREEEREYALTVYGLVRKEKITGKKNMVMDMDIQ